MQSKFFDAAQVSVLNIEKLVDHVHQLSLLARSKSALQELDETAYWLELLVDGEFVKAEKLKDLQNETNELTAIFVSSVKTAKRRK